MQILILYYKTDLLPYFDYDIEKEGNETRKLKPNVDILEVNIKDKQSLQNVIDWINFNYENEIMSFNSKNKKYRY